MRPRLFSVRPLQQAQSILLLSCLLAVGIIVRKRLSGAKAWLRSSKGRLCGRACGVVPGMTCAKRRLIHVT